MSTAIAGLLLNIDAGAGSLRYMEGRPVHLFHVGSLDAFHLLPLGVLKGSACEGVVFVCD